MAPILLAAQAVFPTAEFLSLSRWGVSDSLGATTASGKLGLGTPRVLDCPHPGSHRLLRSPQPAATSATGCAPHRPHPVPCPLISSAQPWEYTRKRARALPMRASCR